MERMAEQPVGFRQNFDQHQRDYDDVTTLFAEMLNGSMRTPFEFSSDGQELYAQDGSTMRTVFEDSLESADDNAERHPNLSFEVRRRRWEIDEHYDMLKMVRGDLPNTMVVVSDFPAELMDAAEDVGGYNVTRKQTMLRVLAWDGEVMRMYSQSLDQSNRQGLEDIYANLGHQPRPGELLGQRLHLQLEAAAEQDLLIDRLMAVYDRSLAGQFGGAWYAGRPDASRINTYDFVRQQHDVIHLALQQQRQGQLDVYAVAATLEARFHRNIAVQPADVIVRHLDPFHNLQREMFQADTRARTMGRVFSGCGVSVGSAQGEPGLGDQLAEGGYGNQTDSETTYKFDKMMYCVDCQAPPEKDAKPKWCGPCGLCRDCDKKHGGKG